MELSQVLWFLLKFEFSFNTEYMENNRFFISRPENQVEYMLVE